MICRETLDFVKEWRENSLYPYCLESCEDRPCCTYFRLNDLSKKDVLFLYGSEDPGLIKRLRKEKRIGKESLFGGTYYLNEACPRYEDGMCTVHEDQERPEACRLFPVVILEQRAQLPDLLFDIKCRFVRERYAEIMEHFENVPCAEKILIK